VGDLLAWLEAPLQSAGITPVLNFGHSTTAQVQRTVDI
jgi:hypothetical protein